MHPGIFLRVPLSFRGSDDSTPSLGGGGGGGGRGARNAARIGLQTATVRESVSVLLSMEPGAVFGGLW